MASELLHSGPGVRVPGGAPQQQNPNFFPIEMCIRDSLHAVQSRPHFLYRPDGALLRGFLGAVHRNRTFDENAPLHGILEGCSQQPVHLVDRRAGKEPLLLLFGQFLLLSLDIRLSLIHI